MKTYMRKIIWFHNHWCILMQTKIASSSFIQEAQFCKHIQTIIPVMEAGARLLDHWAMYPAKRSHCASRVAIAVVVAALVKYYLWSHLIDVEQHWVHARFDTPPRRFNPNGGSRNQRNSLLGRFRSQCFSSPTPIIFVNLHMRLIRVALSERKLCQTPQ
jgi:hypothetical protein